ncbi:MAG: hypothetical protein ACRBK7_31445, partial [Acidimicrobiales bacterium]
GLVEGRPEAALFHRDDEPAEAGVGQSSEVGGIEVSALQSVVAFAPPLVGKCLDGVYHLGDHHSGRSPCTVTRCMTRGSSS